MSDMDCNPHALHQILLRIREQMRCPQCGTKVSVDFPAIKMAGEEYVLLQLKCASCKACIVLHVSMTEVKYALAADHDGCRNASSAMHFDENEVMVLRAELERSGGSFASLFQSTPASPREDRA